MKKDTKTEINAKKLKGKRQWQKVLIVNLLGLILMKKILMGKLKLVKYTITSKNLLENC